MESALAWIGRIAEWLGAFIPRWVILDTTEGAVKFEGFFLPARLRRRLGWFSDDVRITVCSAGLHWYLPVTTRWSEYPIARQTDRLETQTLESKDGRTFIVAGTITWSVEAIEKLVPTTFSPTRTVVELAASAVHDICCDYDYVELQARNRKGTLKTELRNEAQKQLSDYGVKVIKLQLTSLARSRVLKVSQSISNEET